MAKSKSSESSVVPLIFVIDLINGAYILNAT